MLWPLSVPLTQAEEILFEGEVATLMVVVIVAHLRACMIVDVWGFL